MLEDIILAIACLAFLLVLIEFTISVTIDDWIWLRRFFRIAPIIENTIRIPHIAAVQLNRGA
jgi:hypothetical protein